MVLLNLRSWIAHIQQFLVDTGITKQCDIILQRPVHMATVIHKLI